MITDYKAITKKEKVEVVITRWVKPKGYELAVCDLKDPVYNQSLTTVFGKAKEFKRWIKDTRGYDADCESAVAFYLQLDKEGKFNCFLLIQENNWRACDYGVICHELHHFVHYMLDHLGLNYGLGGEEAYAYLQGLYMENLVNAFQELRKAKGYKLK